jgi:gliding motility-associated-like protein
MTASIVADTTGVFGVWVTDSNGCKAFADIRVLLIERKKFGFMNVITPNQDGINDQWKIDDIDLYQPCKLKIFNRWGDELYSSNDYLNDWDGTYKGKDLPEGTYYFIMEAADGNIYKGAVNIVR